MLALCQAAHDPAKLSESLALHVNEITPELAIEARDVFDQALDASQTGLARAAIWVATMIHLQLGNRYEALKAMIDFHQHEFMAANTAEAYVAVSESCDSLIPKAKEITALDLVFRAALVAADSAFYAANSSSTEKERQPWLLNAVRQLVVAADNWQSSLGTNWLRKFATLLGATIDEVEQRLWSETEQEEIRVATRRLTAATEESLPAIFEFPGEPEKTATLARFLARLSYQHGNATVARSRLDVASARTTTLKDWMDIAFSRYIGERTSGASIANLKALRISIQGRTDEYRAQSRSRAGRLWASQNLDQMFGEFLRDGFRNGAADDSDMFLLVEATKARTLLDQMFLQPRELPTAELKTEASEGEKKVLQFAPGSTQALLEFEMKLASQLSIGSTWDRAERSASLDRVEALFAEHRAGYDTARQIPRFAEIKDALRPGETLVEYCIPFHELHPSHELWAVVITNRAIQVVPLPIAAPSTAGFIGRMFIDGREALDASPLSELVTQLRVAIQERRTIEAQQHLESLHRMLVSPLIESGACPPDSRHWIIVPHRMLHYVPFGALSPGPERYLIQDVALSVVPSAAIWFELQRRDRGAVKNFLGLANPTLPYSDLPNLAEAEKELARIAKNLGELEVTVQYRADATEAILRENVAGKGIVHLATHGEFPEMNAIDLHRILLAPSQGHDGRVHAEELRQMDLRATRLMVLSICDGGLYRFGPGDEPYGLMAASLVAGAENVLGTLWPLEESIARPFMVALYKHLLEVGPAEALRHACVSFIEDGGLPDQWAGFVLVGPGRAIR